METDRSSNPAAGVAPLTSQNSGPLAFSAPAQRAGEELPDRYVVRQDDRGRYLSCVEAPDVKVRLEEGSTIPAAAARKAQEGTIFLDGAAQGEPFLDLDRRIYNLDHHEGCVRRFTLSTCEQALVLVVKGLDLRGQPWTVVANDADLDALLAIWVLLNSLHLSEADSPVRRAAIPLIRLEGVIDVHGLELQELAGLPPELQAKSRAHLDRLRQAELEYKSSRGEGQVDLVEHIATQLRRVDQLLYPAGYFAGFEKFEELARAELNRDRVAVVCHSQKGIYELEKELKRLYGGRLGVIALEKAPGAYTLRQVDPFLPGSLAAAYEKLNALDPAVSEGPAGNRWGGSGEIGGSPRSTGSALGPREIAETLRLAYRPPGTVGRLAVVGTAVAASGLVLAATWGTALLAAGGRLPERPTATAAAVGLVVAVVFLSVLGRRHRRLLSLGLPRKLDGFLLLPAALLGAFVGGVWVPVPGSFTGGWPAGAGGWATVLLLPALAEATFRGLAQSLLVRAFRVQSPGGAWFFSAPVVLSAILYAAASAPALFHFGSPAAWLWTLPGQPFVAWFGAAFFGLAAGMARERSATLTLPLLLHYLGAAVLLATPALFG